MKAIYDIRDQIPKFAANFFEQYDRAGKDYPKMMINKETGKPYLDKLKKAIVVQDEHEEKLFLAQHYKPEPVVEAPKAVEIAAAEEPVKRGPGRPPLPKNLTA